MNRLIKVNSFPDKTMGKFNKDNGEAWRLYGILKDIYNKNQNVLEVESQTESGPMTDGKSKRNTNPAQKSFNTEYIRFYFRNEPVKQSFFYFVELVFSDPNPEILCEKFGFCCCLSQTPQEHSYKCCKNWEELKTYVQIKMLEDLEIAAWKPNDLVPKIKESPEEDIFGEEAFIQFNADPEETNIEEIDLEGTELSSFGI